MAVPYASTSTTSSMKFDVKRTKQPAFARFDYCPPSPDQDHHYLCTIFA